MSNLAQIQTVARVDDQWFDPLPTDLYVPPDAFAILLTRFEGPLDFLLYLVRKNGFDLRHLDIAPIASQYIEYIGLMQNLDVELAADYLVMAALLADLKSRLLLPKPSKAVIEEDPRQDLLARLERYAAIKHGAQALGKRPVLGRDVFAIQANCAIAAPDPCAPQQQFDADLLAQAMHAILTKPATPVHAVMAETVHLDERLTSIAQQLSYGKTLEFSQLLRPEQGRMGIVVSLIAVLELLRQGRIRIIHDGDSAPLCLEGCHHDG